MQSPRLERPNAIRPRSLGCQVEGVIAEYIPIVVDHLDELGRRFDAHPDGQLANTAPSAPRICAV